MRTTVLADQRIRADAKMSTVPNMIALTYWTLKSWQDTPVFNLAFWAVIGLVAIYAGWKKRAAKQSTRRE
jgi:hypothetical protein